MFRQQGYLLTALNFTPFQIRAATRVLEGMSNFLENQQLPYVSIRPVGWLRLKCYSTSPFFILTRWFLSIINIPRTWKCLLYRIFVSLDIKFRNWSQCLNCGLWHWSGNKNAIILGYRIDSATLHDFQTKLDKNFPSVGTHFKSTVTAASGAVRRYSIFQVEWDIEKHDQTFTHPLLRQYFVIFLALLSMQKFSSRWDVAYSKL